MNNLIHLTSVLPIDYVNILRKRAEEELNIMYQDYFAGKKFSDFQNSHLGHESLVMKLVAYRFMTTETKQELILRLNSHVKKIYGGSDFLFHPVFYLRFSFPGVYYSKEHQAAFLDSQPHFDRSFNVNAFSFWLALDDVDEESGGLCSFQGHEVQEHFKLSDEGRNRYNYNGYLEASAAIDPVLRRSTVAPAIRSGDMLTFDSTLLHGATKPYSRRRVSFDFRLVSKKELSSASVTVKRMFEEINSDLDLCNAKNLMVLGDSLGSSRILRQIGNLRKNDEILNISEALQLRPPDPVILQPGARMAWKDEYKWLSQNQEAY